MKTMAEEQNKEIREEQNTMEPYGAVEADRNTVKKESHTCFAVSV